MIRSRTVALGCVAATLALCVTGQASAQSLPTPASVLGFEPGADYHLATYEQSIAYFQQLDAASERMDLVEVGRTSENRPFYVAFISSPANLADLERYRQISLRIAHPEGLTDAEAHALAVEGKAIVHIDGAVHASEVACAQHTIQLAFDLLSQAGEPRIARIMENVIFMLWPTANPDGQTMVAEWYMGNVGTPYERAGLPRLYQKYVGHDNNRDAYMLNMIESRVIERTWRHWEPQIRYVHHQTSPFPTRIWLPPFADPVGLQVHPLMAREVNAIGMLIAQSLEENGQVGATHMAPFDAWYPGYVDYMPMFQNAVAFWTETALYAYAIPHEYSQDDIRGAYSDLRPQSLYSSPWKGGWWRLRDAVEYMVTASIATLDYAARFKVELLYNRYQAGRDAIAQHRTEGPYAYLISQEQRDPVAAAELLRRLAFNGLRIYELERPVTVANVVYSAGTWVLPLDQEFAPLARTLLDEQDYPDIRTSPGGPPARPYDVAGWSLPHLFGIEAATVEDPAIAGQVRGAMRPLAGPVADWKAVDAAGGDASPGAPDPATFDTAPGVGFDTDPVASGVLPPVGPLLGSGPSVLVDPAQNNAFRAINQTWRAGGNVGFREDRYVLSGLDADTFARMVGRLRLQAERTTLEGRPVRRPRIGMLRPWQPSMDEGWTRWLLERYEFDFVNIRPAEVPGSPLSDRFDVIVLPDISGRSLLQGYREGSMPDEYVGGMGEEGVQALKTFVEGGGTLVTWNAGCGFAIEQLGLAVIDATSGLPRDGFYIAGSVLGVQVPGGHPVTAGMPAEAAVFYDGSPVFEPQDGFAGTVLARYQAEGSPLLSGFLLGEEYLNGKAAALDVELGEGHVVLLGFGPQWRGQTFGTFRVLFNAIVDAAGGG